MWSSVRSSVVVILIVIAGVLAHAQKCVPRDFGHGSFVCVCNATYCDSQARDVPERGQYRIYDSGKSGNRFSPRTGRFVKNTLIENDINAIKITLEPDVRFQKIVGFGGAFTDAAGINIKTLSEETQNRLMESYFGANGSQYSFGRVPIAGTDFSTREYTYDDVPGDVGLTQWRLAKEDVLYKIPFMKKALTLRPDLKFVSTSWTAPPWMKSNDNYTGFGFLKKEYYQTYAEYLAKFLVAYKNQGLDIWAITPGNEPTDIVLPTVHFNEMGWTPTTVAEFIAKNLGPTIAASKSNETLILIIDDQRYNLPLSISDIFENAAARNYTAGIAIHWYADWMVRPEVIDMTHDRWPDKFILMTEGCAGSFPWETVPVILGDWTRAQEYIVALMENLGHWVTGYVDWNLALNQTGGPNWANNNVDSPIIVNPENDEFFKQPIYYAVAHFSKFIARGSIRIGTKSCGIDNLAFLSPDDEMVIVIYNGDSAPKTVIVTDPQQGNILTDISAYSIQTIIYRT